MDDMSRSIDEKNFFVLAAYTAESSNDQFIISKFEESIKKYNDAKAKGMSEEKLKGIFVEISILSYINVVRMINKKAGDLIQDIQDMEKVLQLIKPNNN